MVQFSLEAALVAGLAGTFAMSAMMTMASRAGITEMPPMPLVIGSMVTGDRSRARLMGAFVHYLVMGTVVFGIIYGLLFTAFGSDGWLTGVVMGAVHGVLVGAVILPMMGAVHPRMSVASPAAAGDSAPGSGELRLPAPGAMGIRWGGMTPLGLIVGHVIFGLVAAIAYGALV